ncbi:unnamed protein product [Rhizophagus irregularis]|nr:unnamed protein product [Rhizophagus irregularis]
MLKIVNGYWQYEPDKRPEIHQVISELKELDNVDSENNDASTSVNSIEYEITEDSENEDFDRFSDCDLSELQPDEHDTLKSNKFYRLTLNSITSRIDVEQHQQVLKVLLYIILVLINIKKLFNMIYPIV